MADINFLTCPFCGGNNITYFFDLVSGFICEDCGCQISGFKTYDDAVVAWNTRKHMEQIVKQLEEAKKYHESRYHKFFDDEERGCMEAYCDAIEIVRDGGN